MDNDSVDCIRSSYTRNFFLNRISLSVLFILSKKVKKIKKMVDLKA